MKMVMIQFSAELFTAHGIVVYLNKHRTHIYVCTVYVYRVHGILTSVTKATTTKA